MTCNHLKPEDPLNFDTIWFRKSAAPVLHQIYQEALDQSSATKSPRLEGRTNVVTVRDYVRTLLSAVYQIHTKLVQLADLMRQEEGTLRSIAEAAKVCTS
jgi:hypothetical protein